MTIEVGTTYMHLRNGRPFQSIRKVRVLSVSEDTVTVVALYGSMRGMEYTVPVTHLGRV